VPGGTFYRGYDVATDGMFTNMTNPATVSDFRLDTYEITVGRFRQFVNAGMGTQASPPMPGAGARTLNGMADQGGWDPAWNASLAADTAALVAAVSCSAMYQSWTNAPGANEALPMDCITWFDAFAFCAWDGGFLPTEAEWNYAAAGGTEQRAYPWSQPASSLTIDCSYLDYNNGTAPCVNPPTAGLSRVGSESPKGDGMYGQADLSGNVWEWILDWDGGYPLPCNDCANLTPTTNRVFRGGGFFLMASYMRTAFHGIFTPASHDAQIGARCARLP
jgi:formylglycine-generating enzyme required for sulfatase activity